MDKKSLENRRSLKGFMVRSWLKCFVPKNTNFCHPVTVNIREKKGEMNKSNYVDKMHEKEHKRVKKSAEQGTNTPDNDMVISVPECCIVCGVTRWRVWPKGQALLSLLPLLALLYNFSKSKVLNVH